MGLAPLKQFGITQVIATTLQAISGAGYPGVPSMDINANVIPFIGGEEEKMQQETQKILGDFAAITSSRWPPRSARIAIACRWWMAIPSPSRSSFPPSPRRPICATPSTTSPAFRRSASCPARRRAR